MKAFTNMITSSTPNFLDGYQDEHDVFNLKLKKKKKKKKQMNNDTETKSDTEEKSNTEVKSNTEAKSDTEGQQRGYLVDFIKIVACSYSSSDENLEKAIQFLTNTKTDNLIKMEKWKKAIQILINAKTG